jgi:two-component system, response regulator PdtaR
MRILVAEDDPLIARGLTERLRSLGHDPLGPASDGARAIELAHASPPDLYLFDIEMPNVDGLQAATQLAADGLRRPVVVVTGVDDPSLIERSIVSGVSAYLTKPVDTRELEAALALATARHAEFEALEAEVDQARQALEDRKLVERAKGLLMSALDLSEQDAFRRLQLTARERNLRLADVARRIVEQQSLLEPARKQRAPK